MKIETFGGAVIAAVVLFATGFLALIQQENVTTWRDISEAAWWVLGGGTLIAFLKDFESLTVRRGLEKVTGSGNVHSPGWICVLALLLGSLAMSGCSGTRAAYQAAEGLDETAKVVGEHYYALVREANAMAEAGELTGTTLVRAQDIVRTTRPVILEMADASIAYSAVRSASNAQELERALSNAALAVSRLIDIIKTRRTSSAIEAIERDLERIQAALPVFAKAA